MGKAAYALPVLGPNSRCLKLMAKTAQTVNWNIYNKTNRKSRKNNFIFWKICTEYKSLAS